MTATMPERSVVQAFTRARLRDCEDGRLFDVLGVNGDDFMAAGEDGLGTSIPIAACHAEDEPHLGCLDAADHATLIEPCVNDCFTWVPATP